MNEKDTSMETPDNLLRERLLLSRAVPGDRLLLADATLLAALDGSRVLTPNERAALQGSPLTLKRFRTLALARRAAATPVAATPADADGWRGSIGMLRAAATATALERLVTDDGYWTLDFLPQADADGRPGWQMIVTLAAQAPFAPRLLREQPLLRVLDGEGAVLLQGRLDHDGECERSWPFAAPPMVHFQLHGAGFVVEAVTF